MRPQPDYCFHRAGYTLTGIKYSFLIHKNQEPITSGHTLTLNSLEDQMGKITPTTRFVEVGTGLDALPYDIHTKINPQNPPIIIDPVNYRIIMDLLQDALLQAQAGRIAVIPEVIQVLETLIQRAHLYTQKDKVLHLPLTLEIALQVHPFLAGYADLVVDNFAAHYYSSNRFETDQQERSILKPTKQSNLIILP